MSKYICSACQREYDEDYGFCHECGGRLVEKEKNDPALNLGDANAISGGVSINQSKNITSHDTHYHSTTVERVKSESELKLEATNQLRAKAEEIMAERGRIDSVAMNQLRPLSKQLGIDEETFKSIIKDVRSNRNGAVSGLSAANARYLQQAQQAVKTNDMDALSNLTPRLEAMAAISQDDNVQFMYYLTLSILYPIKSMEVYERQMDENYWRTFWAIISYIRTGKHAEATKVLALFDPLRYEKSEEDQNLLEAYFNIMKEDKDGAQEFLDEILGEPTEQVKPLLRAVESTLYEEEPESLEVRFFMERVMSKSDVVVKSQKKTETPATKEEPAKTEPKPEKKAEPQSKAKAEETPAHEVKKDNKEAEELYAKACAASGAKRVMLLQKAADAGSLDAMCDLSDCYYDGEGVDKNIALAVKWMSKAADMGSSKAQLQMGGVYYKGADGIDQNYALAEKYLLQATKSDIPDAQAMLADLYFAMEEYEKSLVWARKAAQLGHSYACFILGRIYDEGLGVDANHAEGLKWFEKSADAGDADAQNIVGNIYSNGESVAKDEKKAFRYYQKAAVQGHLWGMYNLSGCYVSGQGTDMDLLKAGEWLRKAAEGGLQEAIDTLNENPQFKDDFQFEEEQLTEEEAQALYDAVDKKTDPNKLTDLQQAAEAGDVWGMYFYARLYTLSDSVNRNYELAVEYYTKAANAGNAKAMCNLGVCYDRGDGVNQDYAEAARWFRKAADAGNALAMANLGVCYENGKGVNQDYAEAVKWYRKAADAGNAWAMGQIGIFYKNGKGVNQDYAEAARWFRKAADAGNALAMANLGVCYENGKGVNQDYAEAVKWYRKAADAGNAWAMGQLGLCYENGNGVSLDISEAIKWYRKGAEKGDAWSMKYLGVCYENGIGVNQDYAEAARWYRKGADAGNALAMCNLGVCYENGKGVNQDYTEAARWYRKAADAGDAKAMGQLGACYLNGTGVNQSDDSGFAYVCKAAEAGEFTAMANVGFCYEFGRGTEANPVEAMKWYQKALDNGYQMDDWLSQRMEECKLKMPSNVEVIFNTAWTTAPNDINTDKWNIYLHLHFQINHCNNRKLYVRFTTELSNANNESTGVILSIIDDECTPNYDFCEWKDYIHWINEGAQNWPNNDSNLRLKTTIQVLDEYKNPLTTNSYWIAYNVYHKIRIFHSNELYLA